MDKEDIKALLDSNGLFLIQVSNILEAKLGVKTPQTPYPHIGIEFEFFSKLGQDKVKYHLLEMGLENFCDLTDDGSIRTPLGFESYELRVLVTQNSYVGVLRRLGKFFRKIKARTNWSCGLHVHLDMRSRDYKKAFKNLYKSQKLLYSLTSKTREKNKFCRPVSDNNYGETRRLGINTEAIQKHNTIEVRIHHGTTNCKRVISWINLLTYIVDNKAVESSSKVQKELKSYIKKYARKAS